jgi:leucyl-tRNA---protein transferase
MPHSTHKKTKLSSSSHHILREWYIHRLKYEWTRGQFFQRFELDRATPLVMDGLWADGWRHFGSQFFRDMYNLEGSRLSRVIPLRVCVQEKSLPRDHRRNLKKNKDLSVEFKSIKFEHEHYEIFEKHAQKFTINRPSDIYQFISPQAQLLPCPSRMCEVRTAEGQLVALSLIDIGSQSISSIYAMFHPDAYTRGLGIYTLLMEVEYARTLQKTYLYTGYAHIQSSYYDYKKRFHGTEFYDWQGTWRPLSQLHTIPFPQHKFEKEDIPQELLLIQDDENESVDDED